MLYLIPEIRRLKESAEIAFRYSAGFEYNDFFHPDVLDDPEEIRRLIGTYLDLPRDRSLDTLHGAFLDVTVHSSDSLIVSASDKRVRQCMEIASELGVKAVIFHTNLVPNFFSEKYMQNWCDRNEVYWRRILKDYAPVRVYMENMFDRIPDCLAQLAEHMKDEPGFGVCLDYAHAYVFGNEPERFCRVLKPYIRHMHINDNDLLRDMHWPVGAGKIDWKKFGAFAKELTEDVTTLIEVSSLEDFVSSAEALRAIGIRRADGKKE